MFISNSQVIKNNARLNFFEKRLDGLDKSIKDSFNNLKKDVNLIKNELKI